MKIFFADQLYLDNMVSLEIIHVDYTHLIVDEKGDVTTGVCQGIGIGRFGVGRTTCGRSIHPCDDYKIAWSAACTKCYRVIYLSHTHAPKKAVSLCSVLGDTVAFWVRPGQVHDGG